jgi:hypothetical protein
VSDLPITSPSGQELLAELPAYYETIQEIRIITQTEGEKFDQLQTDIQDVLNQRFISTATWDIPSWEEEFGVVPPAGQPIDQRRSVVRSKMRGVGKFSGKLLKNVAEAYDNGTVDVSFTPALGEFTVTFVGTRGIPPNLGDAQSAILQIIPSHLVVKFSFTYLRWEEIDASGKTWDQWDALGLTWDQMEIYKP